MDVPEIILDFNKSTLFTWILYNIMWSVNDDLQYDSYILYVILSSMILLVLVLHIMQRSMHLMILQIFTKSMDPSVRDYISKAIYFYSVHDLKAVCLGILFMASIITLNHQEPVFKSSDVYLWLHVIVYLVSMVVFVIDDSIVYFVLFALLQCVSIFAFNYLKTQLDFIISWIIGLVVVYTTTMLLGNTKLKYKPNMISYEPNLISSESKSKSE